MIDTIIAVLRSDAFWVGNMILNWSFCYVFWRLGKKRGQIDRLALLERQQTLLEELHRTLEIARAHNENLQTRLEEALSAK